MENWGRSGFGYLDQFYQFKGIWQGDVYLNDKLLNYWEVIPLEFRKSWTSSLTGNGYFICSKTYLPCGPKYFNTFRISPGILFNVSKNAI